MGNNSSSSVDNPISETSSRCLTDSLTTAHNFEVIRYSELEGMGIGKFVSSSTFSVGGYGWNISMYPDGWKEEGRDAYVSVLLCFCSGAPGVKVKYTLSLLEKDGNVSLLRTTAAITFEPLGYSWGWGKFIEKSKLQELLSRNDDCFTIRCVLTILKEARTEDVSRAIVPIPVPESNLHTHFASMLKDGEGADVTFSVGDQLFNAHRCVLAARSLVVKAKLKETAMKSIKIDDTEPAIFEALLHFIYTDSLPSNCDVDQNVVSQHLLVAADRYGLDRLKAICEEKLCERIDVQTVAATLALAEQHHYVQLKNACLQYLSSLDVLRAVKKTDRFRHLTANCPSISTDILDKMSGL